MRGDFFDTFVSRLQQRDDAEISSYSLSKDTIMNVRVNDYIDTVIESKSGTVQCQFCNTEHKVQDLVYKQYRAGTWINRKLNCTCGAVLYDVPLMSFQLKKGTVLPSRIDRNVD
jgi:hypothetical protein